MRIRLLSSAFNDLVRGRNFTNGWVKDWAVIFWTRFFRTLIR
jgi:hypothetical protein